MGMKKKALKAAGYAMAPKLSLLMNHPTKAAIAKAGMWAGDQFVEKVVPSRFRPQPKRSSLGMAARGLGAAALAAPLGWWLGRKLTRGQETARPAL